MAYRTLYGELYKTFFHLSLRIRDLNVRVRTLEKLCAENHPGLLVEHDKESDYFKKITIYRNNGTRVLEIELLKRARTQYGPNHGLVYGYSKKYYNLSNQLVLTETYILTNAPRNDNNWGQPQPNRLQGIQLQPSPNTTYYY